MAIEVGRLSNRQLLFLINSHRDRGTTGEAIYAEAIDELKRREADQPRLWIGMSLRQLFRYLGKAVAGIMIVFVLIWFTVMFAVLPVIGLVTGDLYIPGKRTGLGTDIYGIWARLISAALLIFFAYGAWSFLKLFLARMRGFRAGHSRTAVIGVWIAVAIVASLAGLAILGMTVGDNS
jgi:hypothetical protein